MENSSGSRLVDGEHVAYLDAAMKTLVTVVEAADELEIPAWRLAYLLEQELLPASQSKMGIPLLSSQAFNLAPRTLKRQHFLKQQRQALCHLESGGTNDHETE